MAASAVRPGRLMLRAVWRPITVVMAGAGSDRTAQRLWRGVDRIQMCLALEGLESRVEVEVESATGRSTRLLCLGSDPEAGNECRWRRP